jgi:hypothetical protein
LDGLREAEEELGWTFQPEDITLIGRRLSVGINSAGRERRLVVTIFMTYDDLPLSRFILDPKEVPAIYEILLDDVENAFADPKSQFTAHGINCYGEPVKKVASYDDFSYMFDSYHLRMAEIARRFAKGERLFHY